MQPLHNVSPCHVRLSVSSHFCLALSEAHTCQGWVACSQTLQTGCGLWAELNGRSLDCLLVLFLETEHPGQWLSSPNTPRPLLRTRAWLSVRGIIFSWVIISKPLREKLFWKHFLDLEYSKMESLSCYLFIGTKSKAGVEALLTAVTRLHPFCSISNTAPLWPLLWETVLSSLLRPDRI